jgi:hypothetical protein
VRELVGEDGEVFAEYMLSVMTSEKAKTADRLDAARDAAKLDASR